MANDNSVPSLAHQRELSVNRKETPRCPDEVELLSFVEGKLGMLRRRKVRKHLSDCDNCRQVLVLLSKSDTPGQREQREEIIDRQVELIRRMSESNDDSPEAKTISQGQTPEAAPASLVDGYQSRGRWAMVAIAAVAAVAAIAIPVIHRQFVRKPSGREAMVALADAVKSQRRTRPWISGNLPHSPYVAATGSSRDDTVQYDRAATILESKDTTSLSDEDSQNLARIYLARATPEDAGKALAILSRISGHGTPTASQSNDTGVAYFELGQYDRALEYFTETVRAQSGYPEGLFNKALVEEVLGRSANARADWQVFMAVSPKSGWRNEAEDHLRQIDQSQPK